MNLWALWGKTSDQADHPLLFHMVDIAEVVRAVWDLVFTESVRCDVARHLGLSVDDAGRVLPFWAGLRFPHTRGGEPLITVWQGYNEVFSPHTWG